MSTGVGGWADGGGALIKGGLGDGSRSGGNGRLECKRDKGIFFRYTGGLIHRMNTNGM